MTAESPPPPLGSTSSRFNSAHTTISSTTNTMANALFHEKSFKTIEQCFLKFYFKGTLFSLKSLDNDLN